MKQACSFKAVRLFFFSHPQPKLEVVYYLHAENMLSMEDLLERYVLARRASLFYFMPLSDNFFYVQHPCIIFLLLKCGFGPKLCMDVSLVHRFYCLN